MRKREWFIEKYKKQDEPIKRTMEKVDSIIERKVANKQYMADPELPGLPLEFQLLSLYTESTL